MGNLMNKEWSNIENEEESKPEKNNSKVIVADFDPRSPSSGIQRTPIIYMTSSNDRNSSKNNMFFNDSKDYYQQTPTNPKNYKVLDSISNQSFNMTADLSSTSDSSYLIQESFDNNAHEQSLDSNASPDRVNSISSSKTLTNIGGNLPRNILKRKQVEKINKKKFQNLDFKENCE